MNKLAIPINHTSCKVIAFLVCVVLSFGFIYVVSAQSTAVNAAASTTQPQVGSTLTVTLTISNVQNLFGIDATLQWNPSVLSLTKTALNLGDSQHNGVLHGSNLNYDANNLNSGDIYVNETKVSGSYELVAQSIGASTSSFNGSGTIATLTFNVVSAGSAGLSLQTDLADKAALGQNSNNIAHTDTADSVTAVAAGSSSTPTNSPTNSHTSTPTPTPEFPTLATLSIVLVLASAAIVLSAKKIIKPSSTSGIKPQI